MTTLLSNNTASINTMSTLEKKLADEFTMTGNWKEQARVLKRRFPLLNDADMKYEEGKENDLLKRMEMRLNKNREEIIRLIRQGQTSKV